MLIDVVTGTRPNLVKAAPLIREIEKQGIEYRFIHTHQHHDHTLYEKNLQDLGMPEPHHCFSSVNVNPAYRVANIIEKYVDCHLCHKKTDMVLVFGDVDSSLAISIAANKLGIILGHIEAGERSGNRAMTEEINRILIDEMAGYHFCASHIAHAVIRKTYRDSDKNFLVGNLMIDQLKHTVTTKKPTKISKKPYGILTLHRQENVDDPDTLNKFLKVVDAISENKIKIYFPVHPRTLKNIKGEYPSIIFEDPWGYCDFVNAMRGCQFIITDSGGVQVEASCLNIPTITVRNETEWLDTIAYGSNISIGEIGYPDVAGYFLQRAVGQIMDRKWKWSQFTELPIYKMNAAENIVNIIKEMKL